MVSPQQISNVSRRPRTTTPDEDIIPLHHHHHHTTAKYKRLGNRNYCNKTHKWVAETGNLIYRVMGTKLLHNISIIIIILPLSDKATLYICEVVHWTVSQSVKQRERMTKESPQSDDVNVLLANFSRQGTRRRGRSGINSELEVW